MEWETLPPEHASQHPATQRLLFEIIRQPDELRVRCWLLSPDGGANYELGELFGNAADLGHIPLLPSLVEEAILQAMRGVSGETVLGALEKWEWVTAADTGDLISLTRVWRSPLLRESAPLLERSAAQMFADRWFGPRC